MNAFSKWEKKKRKKENITSNWGEKNQVYQWDSLGGWKGASWVFLLVDSFSAFLSSLDSCLNSSPFLGGEGEKRGVVWGGVVGEGFFHQRSWSYAANGVFPMKLPCEHGAWTRMLAGCSAEVGSSNTLVWDTEDAWSGEDKRGKSRNLG